MTGPYFLSPTHPSLSATIVRHAAAVRAHPLTHPPSPTLSSTFSPTLIPLSLTHHYDDSGMLLLFVLMGALSLTYTLLTNPLTLSHHHDCHHCQACCCCSCSPSLTPSSPPSLAHHCHHCQACCCCSCSPSLTPSYPPSLAHHYHPRHAATVRAHGRVRRILQCSAVQDLQGQAVAALYPTHSHPLPGSVSSNTLSCSTTTACILVIYQ